MTVGVELAQNRRDSQDMELACFLDFSLTFYPGPSITVS